MIFTTFLVVIFSILFGMYMGVRWAKGDDVYIDISRFACKLKRFIKKMFS